MIITHRRSSPSSRAKVLLKRAGKSAPLLWRFYEAICFDFDGVLADSEPVHFDCWMEVLKSLGIQVDWTIYAKYCIGVPDALVAEFFRHLVDPPATYAAIWARHTRKSDPFRARMRAAPPITEAVTRLF